MNNLLHIKSIGICNVKATSVVLGQAEKCDHTTMEHVLRQMLLPVLSQTGHKVRILWFNDFFLQNGQALNCCLRNGASDYWHATHEIKHEDKIN